MKQFACKVKKSAGDTPASSRNSSSLTVIDSGTSLGIESAVPVQARSGDSWLTSPQSFREVFLRRDDLLKPDVMSEVILLGAGALVFAILILILIVVLTQASAPI